MKKILHLKIISRILSIDLLIISIALMLCSTVALIYAEPVLPFVLSSLIALTIAAVFYYMGAKIRVDQHLTRKDAYFTVTVSWIIIAFAGMFPYIISGSIPSVIDALFESVSGFSTTGASILKDIEVLPKSILFWRSLTHWIGGIGIIILVIIILPSYNIGGYHLFTMEASAKEKIRPRTRSIGRIMLYIYLSLTLLEILLLMAGNMNLFESTCHAFGTIATGGFSPRNSSIIDYSPYIQYVIMIFMLFAGTNFSIYYYLVMRDFSKIRANDEFRFYLVVVFIIGTILTLSLFRDMGKPLEESFRESFFQIISIISCTGFASADYLKWPVYGWFIIFLAMFLGGSTGSTSGGIKMARHLIALKNVRRIFRQTVHTTAVIPLRVNKRAISEQFNYEILGFMVIYLLVFVVGTLALCLMSIDIPTSASSVATCMAGIGPGIGTVGPVSNYAHLPDMAKIVLSIMMLLGRLEIFTVFVLFTRNFWRP